MDMLKLARSICYAGYPEYSEYVPSIETVAAFMLDQAARALRTHDLAEARFWQDGYLSIRPIVKTEIELASYLGAREMARV